MTLLTNARVLRYTFDGVRYYSIVYLYAYVNDYM